MKIKTTFFHLILLTLFIQNDSFSQAEICTIDSRNYICLGDKIIMDTIITFNGRKYNYFEKDSTGHYTVLGNTNNNNVPNGYWYFYYKNVNRKGNGLNFWSSAEYDWCYGKVKKQKLHGKWYFYGTKYKIYKNGIITESWQF